MIPADLQQRAIPALIISSVDFLVTANADDLWQETIIRMEEPTALAAFLDSDVPTADLLAFDLIHVAQAEIVAMCGNEQRVQRSSWHRWQIWKMLHEQNSELGSIKAELESFRSCNSALFNPVSFEFENGKLGLRRVFNRKVFATLQKTFRKSTNDLKG